MRQDLTDITLVIDRSGSMNEIRLDAEGGVNAFIKKQAELPGEALLTLVEFDTEYDFVHRGVPIEEVPDYGLMPRGATALLDAVGRAIHETGARLAAMDESDRPGLVVFVVMTDGMENSSREFSKQKIQDMIHEQQSKYSWHFNFLGADLSTFDEGRSMGFFSGGVAQWDKENVNAAYLATSSKVGRMRRQASSGQTVVNEFLDEEREQMKK